MAAIIFKAILFYFIYVVGRTIFRTYKSVKAVQGAAKSAQKKQTVKRKTSDKVFEAEFRNLD